MKTQKHSPSFDNPSGENIQPSNLSYHECTRSIVFRGERNSADAKCRHVRFQPLPQLEFTSSDLFQSLIDSAIPANMSEQQNQGDGDFEWTDAECEVIQMLRDEQAVVKTIKNCDWGSFLDHFKNSKINQRRYPDYHVDIPPKDGEFCFNSFVTSCSLLPSLGKKMRCYGSTLDHTVGVVFALPKTFKSDNDEEVSAKDTRTWSWPSGYSAKTEFNINDKGELINGREEALVSLCGLRKNNHSYLHDTDYKIAGRLVKGGFKSVPYNEIMVRVGGIGRIVDNKDFSTGHIEVTQNGYHRSFEQGLGLPVALFIRTACASDIVSLLRTRARTYSILGRKHMEGIPLLLITPDLGVRVLSRGLLEQFYKIMANQLKPFQNPHIFHRTSIDRADEDCLQQKLEELIDLDADGIRKSLTMAECSRIAGGFGATDNSVGKLFTDAMRQDIPTCISTPTKDKGEGRFNTLQQIVKEGMTYALRSDDYHIARQILIYYSISSKMSQKQNRQENELDDDIYSSSPPLLDMHLLCAATSSDGLLCVLGAFEVLKCMSDHSAKQRIDDMVIVLNEWLKQSESAEIVTSWSEQLAAQAKLAIVGDDVNHHFAIVSHNDIEVLSKLRDRLLVASDFDDIRFLSCLSDILMQMSSRSELDTLQYILNLDKRFSALHLIRSVEIAALAIVESGDREHAESLSEYNHVQKVLKYLQGQRSDTSHDHLRNDGLEENPLWHEVCTRFSTFKARFLSNDIGSLPYDVDTYGKE